MKLFLIHKFGVPPAGPDMTAGGDVMLKYYKDNGLYKNKIVKDFFRKPMVNSTQGELAFFRKPDYKVGQDKWALFLYEWVSEESIRVGTIKVVKSLENAFQNTYNSYDILAGNKWITNVKIELKSILDGGTFKINFNFDMAAFQKSLHDSYLLEKPKTPEHKPEPELEPEEPEGEAVTGPKGPEESAVGSPDAPDITEAKNPLPNLIARFGANARKWRKNNPFPEWLKQHPDLAFPGETWHQLAQSYAADKLGIEYDDVTDLSGYETIVFFPNEPPLRQAVIQTTDWKEEEDPFYDRSKNIYSTRVILNTGSGSRDEILKTVFGEGKIELKKLRDNKIAMEAVKLRAIETIEKHFDTTIPRDKEFPLGLLTIPSGPLGMYLQAREKSVSRLLIRVDLPKEKLDELAAKDPLQEHAEAIVAMAEDAADEIVSALARKTAAYSTQEFTQQIKLVTTVMRMHAKSIKFGSSELEYLNLELEAKRLEAIPSLLTDFFSKNSRSLASFDVVSDNRFQFEFTNDFELTAIIFRLWGKEGEPGTPLKVGFESLKKKKQFSSPRTMAYLFYLADIYKEYNKPRSSALPWLDFVKKYTFPIPSMRLKPETDIGELALIAILGPLDLDKQPIYVKSREDIGIEIKQKIFKSLENTHEFIGNTFLSGAAEKMTLFDLNATNSKGESTVLLQLYKQILQKIPMDELIRLAGSCLQNFLGIDDYKKTVCTRLLKKLKLHQLEEDLIPALAKQGPSGKAAAAKLKEMVNEQKIKIYATAKEFNKNLPELITPDIEQWIEVTPKPGKGAPYSIDGKLTPEKKKELLNDPDIASVASKAGLVPISAKDIEKIKNNVEKAYKTAGKSGNQLPFSAIEDVTKSNFFTDVEHELAICTAIFGIFPAAVAMLASISPSQNLALERKIRGDTAVLKDALEKRIRIFAMKNIPTYDILKDIPDMVTQLLLNVLQDVFLFFIKKIMEALKLCDGKKKDLNNTPEEIKVMGGISLPDLMLSTDNKDPQQLFQELMNCFTVVDIPTDFFINKSDVITLFQTISDVLTPSEICAALKGNINSEVFAAINLTINQNYPQLNEHFSNAAKLEELFLCISSLVGSNLCEDAVLEFNSAKQYRNDLCENPSTSAIEDILGETLGPDDIARQILYDRNSLKQNVLDLMPFLDDDLFDKLTPSIFCGPGGKEGAFPQQHESEKYLSDFVNKAIFQSIEKIFDSESQNFKTIIDEERLDLLSWLNPTSSTGAGANTKISKIQKMIFDTEMKDKKVKSDDLKALEVAPIYVANKLRENLRRSTTIINDNPVFFATESLNYQILKWKVEDRQIIFAVNLSDEAIDAELPGTSIITNPKSLQIIIYEEDSIEDEFGKTIILTNVEELSEVLMPQEALNFHKNISKIILDEEYFPSLPLNVDDWLIHQTVGTSIDPVQSEPEPESIGMNLFYGYIFSDIIEQSLDITSHNGLFLKENFKKLNLIHEEDEDPCEKEKSDGDRISNFLDVSSIKDKMDQYYEILECKIERNATPSAREVANILGTINLFIRIHVLQEMLKGIFIFSLFKLSDIAQSSIFMSTLIGNIKKTIMFNLGEDSAEIESFLRQVVPILKQSKNKNQTITAEKENSDDALIFLIKEQIKDFEPALEKVIGLNPNPGWEERFFGYFADMKEGVFGETSEDEFSKRFLDYIIHPEIFDLPALYMFDRTTTKAFGYTPSPRFLGKLASGLYLERYVEIESIEGVADLAPDIIIASAGYPDIMDVHKDDISKKLRNSVAFNFIFHHRQDAWVAQGELAKYSFLGKINIGQAKNHYKFSLPAAEEEGTHLFWGFGGTDSLKKGLLNQPYLSFFKPIKVGLRLCALIRPDPNTPENSEPSFSTMRNYYDVLRGKVDDNLSEAEWKRYPKQKVLFQGEIESGEADYMIIPIAEVSEELYKGTGKTMTVGGGPTGWVNPSTATVRDIFRDPEELNATENPVGLSAMLDNYDFGKLKNLLTNTSDYKIFLKTFPIKQMIGAVAMYHLLAMDSMYPELNRLFDGTRNQIIDLLRTQQTISKRDYTSTSPAAEPLSDTFGKLSFDASAMIAAIPKLLIKAAANTIDPTWKTPWFLPGPLTPFGIAAKLMEPDKDASKKEEVDCEEKKEFVEAKQKALNPDPKNPPDPPTPEPTPPVSKEEAIPPEIRSVPERDLFISTSFATAAPGESTTKGLEKAGSITQTGFVVPPGGNKPPIPEE